MRAFQVLPLLLLLSSVACSSAQTAHDPTKPQPPRTTVQVRNQRPIDFNLYVSTGTHRIRLGTVPGMSQRTFTIPAHLIPGQGMLRFHIDPIGSQDVLSTAEDLMVHEGDQVSLTI
ncbi:MAG: hypothetical protein JXB05_36255 [Myxococcaceae bacterium]|nr:hypothetical protein [Myxococcaceae bacterium]